jgi:hypothetical protein
LKVDQGVQIVEIVGAPPAVTLVHDELMRRFGLKALQRELFVVTGEDPRPRLIGHNRAYRRDQYAATWRSGYREAK